MVQLSTQIHPTQPLQSYLSSASKNIGCIFHTGRAVLAVHASTVGTLFQLFPDELRELLCIGVSTRAVNYLEYYPKAMPFIPAVFGLHKGKKIGVVLIFLLVWSW